MTLTDGRIGQLLGGKYRVEELLARGGMGLVYAARHETTGRSVAIKLLRSELVVRADIVRRVSAEARLAVEASHPNVVEVLDAGADDQGVPYLVLERLFGHTLEALLARPLPLLAAAQALIPIMNALAALHRAGIVHRDIKPANLFLSQDDEDRITPKLLDFGIAKALESSSSTLSGTALGTPAYMAPEQALGRKVLGPQTDVWSMGIVLVRCLTLTLPFDAQETHRLGVLGAGLHESDLQGIAEPVARVLTRALRLDPLERFEHMAEFRDALIAALASVDASLAWPNETSTSYGSSETELAARLGDVGPEPETKASTARLGRGRRGQIATRTLAQSGPKSPRRSPGRVLATLAVSATLIAAGARYAGLVGGPPDSERPAAASLPVERSHAFAAAPRTEPLAPADVAAIHRVGDPPAALAPISDQALSSGAPSASPGAPPPKLRPRAELVPPAASGAAARPPAAAAAAAPTPEPSQRAEPQWIGANRAPIIE